MQWHKLDRDRTVAMIDSVKTSGDHMLFSLGTSEAKAAKLSFYKNLMLYRLTNYSSLPSFSFDYLGDGKTYFYLDGSPGPIYHANDSGNLSLNEQSVVDYVVFFFNHVSGPEGDIFVIEDPQNHPALDALSDTQLDAILTQHTDPEVAAHGNGAYTIKASMYYLASLVRATIYVDTDGRVSVKDFQMLLSVAGDIETPESIRA